MDMWAGAQVKVKWCNHLRGQIPSGSKVCNEINTLNEKIQFFCIQKDQIVEPNNKKLNKCYFLKFRNFCCWTPLQLLAPGTKKPSFATAGGL